MQNDAYDETRTTTIEPTHEALLRQWGLLEGWLAEDFGLLATLESLKRAARDWDANGRVDAWLVHQGQRLTDAQTLNTRTDIASQLDQTDRAYLRFCVDSDDRMRKEAEKHRSEREAEQERRVRDAEALSASRFRSTRRLAAGAIIALLLATTTYWEWSEATLRKSFALNSFKDSTIARLELIKRDFNKIDFSLTDANKDLSTISEGIQNRQEDAEFIEEKAKTLLLWSSVLYKMGNVKDSLNKAQYADFVLDMPPSSQKKPGTEELKAKVNDSIASIYLSMNELNEAYAHYEVAASHWKKSFENYNSEQIKDHMADSIAMAGKSLMLQGKSQDSFDLLKKSFAIRGGTPEVLNSFNCQQQSRLFVSYIAFGDFFAFQGNLTEAIKNYQKSLSCLDRKEHLQQLANLYQIQAGALLNDNKSTQAMDLLQASLQIKRTFALNHFNDAIAQDELVQCYILLSEAYDKASQIQKAIENLETALKITQQLAIADRYNVGWQRDISYINGEIGRLMYLSGEGKSRDRIQRSLTVIRQLMNEDNEFYVYHVDVVRLNIYLANIGDDKKARLRIVANEIKNISRNRKLSKDLLQWEKTAKEGLLEHDEIASLSNANKDNTSSPNNKPQPQTIIENTGASKEHLRLRDILKKPNYREAFERMLSGNQELPNWMVSTDAVSATTETPGEDTVIGVEDWKVFRACESHNCDRQNIVVIFSSSEPLVCKGLLSIDGAARFLGNPSAAEAKLLLDYL